MDMLRLMDFHSYKQSDFSVVLRQVEDVSRYGTVDRDENYRIISFTEKGTRIGLRINQWRHLPDQQEIF